MVVWRRNPGCPGWVLCGQCRSPFVGSKGFGGVRAGGCVASAGVSMFACKGCLGGFGWLMFEEVLGAFMAPIFSLSACGGV